VRIPECSMLFYGCGRCCAGVAEANQSSARLCCEKTTAESEQVRISASAELIGRTPDEENERANAATSPASSSTPKDTSIPPPVLDRRPPGTINVLACSNE
jgi:hypothetical protein